MEKEDFKLRYEESQQRSKEFLEGFRSGEKHAKEQIKHNKILYNLLLEVIGYEDEWLTTVAGYKKKNKDDLIDIILKQRKLMRTIYNVDASEKEKLKVKIEKFFWSVVHKEE